MGFTKALYYPTIDIHNEDWLKSAIFFWDEISTIVPRSIDTPYQTDSTRYLFDQGILQPLIVDPDQNFIEELTEDTLNYLNSNEGFQLLTQGRNIDINLHRDKFPREISNLLYMHPDKLSFEIQHRLSRKLSLDGWFAVDSNFAKFYMTLLANKLCEGRSIALLTDNNFSSNFSDKIRLDNQIALFGGDHFHFNQNRHEKYINLVQGLLTNLIVKGIQIKGGSSLADIVDFKKRHQDELGLFRNNIAKLTQNVSKDLTVEAIQQQIQDIYKDEFLPSYNNLKKSLDGSGIKWAADNFMKVSFFSTSATAIPSALLGMGIPQALLLGIGVSMITSAISYNVDKQEKLRNNPYSYLLAINERL